MKKLRILLLTILILGMSVTAFALPQHSGFYFDDPTHWINGDPIQPGDIDYFTVYWTTPGGLFSDAQSANVGDVNMVNWTTTIPGLQAGDQYELGVTVTNSINGNESQFANPRVPVTFVGAALDPSGLNPRLGY